MTIPKICGVTAEFIKEMCRKSSSTPTTSTISTSPIGWSCFTLRLVLLLFLVTFVLWTAHCWTLAPAGFLLELIPKSLLLILRSEVRSYGLTALDEGELSNVFHQPFGDEEDLARDHSPMGGGHGAKKHHDPRSKTSSGQNSDSVYGFKSIASRQPIERRTNTEEEGADNSLAVSYYYGEPFDFFPSTDVVPTTDYDGRDGIAVRTAEPSSSGTQKITDAVEALSTLHAAIEFRKNGKISRAKRLFEHALALAPKHPDVLNEFGVFMENHSKDIVYAEKMYTKALNYAPYHEGALTNRERTQPLVEEIDNRMLGIIDQKRSFFLDLPRHSPYLRRAMKEAYFLHVYHTVAIEGNTMTLMQTRSILETRVAVGGKSVVEHNEILGMDAALRYLNRTLVHRIGSIMLQDIKEIHRRVLGFVDPFQAGVFRDSQVYVGDFVPTPPYRIDEEMSEFVEWLNSDSTLRIHPVELAALAHYKFVYIHPFVDGNGRTARLLMNLILMQAGFPPVIIRVEDRLDYYETLQAANEGDLRPFIRFIASATDRTLDSYLAIFNSKRSNKHFDQVGRKLEPMANMEL